MIFQTKRVIESDSSEWVKGVARERVRLANDPQVKDRSFCASTVARLVLGGSRATYRLRLPITPSLFFEGIIIAYICCLCAHLDGAIRLDFGWLAEPSLHGRVPYPSKAHPFSCLSKIKPFLARLDTCTIRAVWPPQLAFCFRHVGLYGPFFSSDNYRSRKEGGYTSQLYQAANVTKARVEEEGKEVEAGVEVASEAKAGDWVIYEEVLVRPVPDPSD